jgi:hypothetical protein
MKKNKKAYKPKHITPGKHLQNLIKSLSVALAFIMMLSIWVFPTSGSTDDLLEGGGAAIESLPQEKSTASSGLPNRQAVDLIDDTKESKGNKDGADSGDTGAGNTGAGDTGAGSTGAGDSGAGGGSGDAGSGAAKGFGDSGAAKGSGDAGAAGGSGGAGTVGGSGDSGAGGGSGDAGSGAGGDSGDANSGVTGDTEEEAGESTEKPGPGAAEAGSIAGLLWANLDDSFDKQPLVDYTVYLYTADNLQQTLAKTRTDAQGAYIYEELAPGSYVLGLAAETIDSAKYQLPAALTAENKFALSSGSEPPMAYTEVIELEEGQAIAEINAALRLYIEEDKDGEAGQTDGGGEVLPAESEPGSIAGFMWVDGDGSLPTCFDGLYNGDEQPLADYPIYLYAADDLDNILRETCTDLDGVYTFVELGPGSYVVGLASETVDEVEYLLPLAVTAENKFATNWESGSPLAYTEVIALGEGQAVEDIDAGMRLPLGIMAAASHEINLSELKNGSKGTGWGYSGTADNGTITFYGNDATYGSASNNEYTIIMKVGGNNILKHIKINPDVSNITIRYDGPNIKMPTVGAQALYYNFFSNVTINGKNNSVIFDALVNLSRSTITIESGAENASVSFIRGNHDSCQKTDPDRTFTIIDSGSSSNISFEGTKFGTVTINYNNTVAGNKASLYLRGGIMTDTLFEAMLKGGANLDLLLSGTNTISNGRIEVSPSASLTIDSAVMPGSESGSLSITHGSSVNATIGGAKANSGQITIKGGTLTVTQNNAGATAIGGGYNGDGYVTITGGNVNANALSGVSPGAAATGAAIGGGKSGQGYVTITGGAVTATVGNLVYATANCYGAVIGGGDQSNGTVIIEGGTIIAKTEGFGAAIGGGGSSGSSGQPGTGTVTITGGDLSLRSYGGACIGNGGRDTTIGTKATVGKVTITGGTIFGDTNKGNIVGSGGNYTNTPLIHIDAGADIVGFGRETTNFPPINCGQNDADKNIGNGYFVNGSFGAGKGSSSGMLIVYEKSNLAVPARVVNVPFGFTEFCYTTGTTSTRTDYVYIGTTSQGLKQVVRQSLGTTHTADLGAIYSVLRPMDYHDNGHLYQNYWRSLAVKHGDNFKFNLAVTEKHVDIYGKSIPGTKDFVTLVESTKDYSKPITNIPGYIIKGYRVDSKPAGDGTYTQATTASITNVTKNTDIYFVYDLPPPTADVTVSKAVKGAFAELDKAFTFSLRLVDTTNSTPACVGESFSYVGGVLPGFIATAPADGSITIDEYGAEFSLSHGQTITIKGLPVGIMLQVVEYKDAGYTARIDEDKGFYLTNGLYSYPVILSAADYTFNFTNKRVMAPPTGFNDSLWTLETLLLSIMLSIVLGLATIEIRRRIKCTRSRL